jgi:type IV secretion system protein VirD4
MKKFITIILAVLQFMFSIVGRFFTMLIDEFTKPSRGNAKFHPASSIASWVNRGYVVASNHFKITRKASFSNAAIIGVTGSGKSTRLIIPTALSLTNCSLLIHDPSQEIGEKTMPRRLQSGPVKVINFSDEQVSDGFNPLSRCTDEYEISKLAHQIVVTSDKNSGDDYWQLSSKDLLKSMIMLLFHQPPEYRNIRNVIHVVNTFASEPSKVDTWISNTKNEKLIENYKAIISTPSKTLQCTVSSLRSTLECFDTPTIARITAHDTIDFNSLRKQQQTIYLQNSITDLSVLSTLTSLFFQQFYTHVLQRLPQKEDLDIFCLLDEMSSLRVPLLPLALANCRKFRVGNLCAIQGKSQLRGFYKDDAESILSNCLTKIYLPGITAIDELREIEALSGKYTYTENNREKTKSLVTVDEIRQLNKNRALILHQNLPIIKARTSPYYHSLIYRRYTSLPPITLMRKIPDTPIPLLK